MWHLKHSASKRAPAALHSVWTAAPRTPSPACMGGSWDEWFSTPRKHTRTTDLILATQQHTARQEKKQIKSPNYSPFIRAGLTACQSQAAAPGLHHVSRGEWLRKGGRSHFEEDILSGCLLHFHWRILHFTGDLILVNPMNALVIPHSVRGGGCGVMAKAEKLHLQQQRRKTPKWPGLGVPSCSVSPSSVWQLEHFITWLHTMH